MVVWIYSVWQLIVVSCFFGKCNAGRYVADKQARVLAYVTLTVVQYTDVALKWMSITQNASLFYGNFIISVIHNLGLLRHRSMLL